MADQLSTKLASLRIDRDVRPPRKSPLRVVAMVAALGAALAVVYAAMIPRVRSKLFKTEVAVTEIVVIAPSRGAVELTSSGYVVPQTLSQVAAKVPGRVAEVRIEQGQKVAAGQVLLVLDVADQRAAIAAARSRVAAARATAMTARANLAEAAQQADRAKRLAERGVSPGATADDLAARVTSQTAAVRAADAQAQAAQAEVAALEVGLDNYTLTSPIAGTVINDPPEVGDMVGPAMSGIASQVGGVEIADFTSLAVETDVPEGRLHMVKLEAPAEIMLDAFPDRRYRGRVSEIVPRVNRAKATVTVKVVFTDEPAEVLPDMSARVSFLAEELDAAAMAEPPKTVVPGAAVVDRQGAKVVFVVDGERARMTPVELGEPVGDGFALVRGPAPGTRLVERPSPDLADGERIKERNQE
jgi:RND family efflux transporter MFP subunit